MAIYSLIRHGIRPAPSKIENHEGQDLLTALRYLIKYMRENKFVYPASPGKSRGNYLKTFVVSEEKVPQMRQFFDRDDLFFKFDFRTEPWSAPGKVVAKFFFRKQIGGKNRRG